MIIYNESNERHQNEFFTKQLHININMNMFTHMIKGYTTKVTTSYN